MNAVPDAAALVAARARIAALDARAERHDVDVGGGKRMAWRRFGEGPPLVLVHGGHGSWMHWIRNIEALSTRHALWIPDLPGYGDSDALESRDVDAIIEATARAMDALVGANTDVDLCGFSFGGLVASRVAASRGRARRLCLIGTAGHGLESRRRQELRNWRLARDPATLWSAMRHNLAAHMIHDPSAIDALALEAHRASCAATRFRSKHISHAALLAPILRSIEAPVLLVWGEHDLTTSPEEAARALAGSRPAISWRIVPGAGHWAQYERAEEVNGLLSGTDPVFP